MKEFSILIGGKAGDGINQAGLIIARLFNKIGFRPYIYYDYPSLIRGGHNFSLIRLSSEKKSAILEKVNFLLALNQDAIDFHKNKLNKENAFILYDADGIEAEGTSVPLSAAVKKENAPDIVRNTGMIAALAKAVGIDWDTLKEVLEKNIEKEIEINLKIAKIIFNQTKELIKIDYLKNKPLPLVTGNEAISLGLIKAGLQAYVAYPMTPASSVLHILANLSKKFSIKVVHPENEIAVMLMALGFAYAGEKVAVGTSGGGFCLMTEGLSLAGMAETPVVIIMSQRPGPSTGVPTYTAQADLNFILNAGHGDFVRLVIAPADAEEAYLWSQIILNLSWQCQIPSILLVDKALSEGSFSFDQDFLPTVKEEGALIWDQKGEYKRYLDTKDGISPVAFPSTKNAVIKVTSYDHDQYGITTEETDLIIKRQDKQLAKNKKLTKLLKQYKTVCTYGKQDSKTAVICWGSNKGVCIEAAERLGLRVVHPVVLLPFPEQEMKTALKGAEKVICVETNATGQLARLLKIYEIKVDYKILKYDGRPFSVEELERKINENE